MSSISIDVIRADSSAVDAQLLLGLKGDKGDQGDTGASAGFGTVTASVDANVGTPSVTVTASGTDTAKNFDFAFHNLKGADGVCDVNDVKVMNKMYGTDTEAYTSQLYSGNALLTNADFGTLGYVEATSNGNGTHTVSETTSIRLSDGGIILVKFGVDSGNGDTLNIHAQDAAYTGAIPIYVNGSAISAGDIKAGDVVALSYDSGNNRWHVIGKSYPRFTSSRDGLVPAAGNVSETGEWKLLSNEGWLTVGVVAEYDSPKIPWARKYSAELTGVPTAPTAPTTTNNTQIATTAFVKSVVGSMVSGVSDVEVDGSSVVSNGVAQIPYANEDGYGVVKIEEDSGLAVTWTDVDGNELTYHLPYFDQNFKISSLDLPIATSSTFGAVKFNDGNASTTNGYVSITGSGGTARCVPLLNGEYVMNPSNLPLATTSAGGAMSASDKSKLDGIEVPTKVSDLENDVPFADINQLYSILPTDTASGSIASFTDGADDVPMLSVVADIEPIQDLHGYDKPWSGGAGKNKLNVTANTQTIYGITYTVNRDSGGNLLSIVANGTATSRSVLVLWLDYSDLSTFGLSGIYTLSGCPSGGSDSTYGLVLQAEGPGNIVDAGSGITFDTSAITQQSYRFIIDIKSGTTANGLVFKPMLRLATESDATYAPYSNICPIYGHTEEVVEQRGINVWDEEWEVGDISYINGQNQDTGDRVRSKGYTSVKPNTQYTCTRIGTTGVYAIFFYDADKTYLGHYADLGTSQGVFTTPTNCAFIRFRTYIAYGTTYNHDISINYPSTDHDYHAYQGETYTTQFGQTVYGGSVDLVSGVLTVDTVFRNARDRVWDDITNGGVHYYCTPNSQLKVDGYRNKLWCNMFETVVTPYLNPSADCTITNAYARGQNVNVRYDAISTLADWNTFIANNDVEIVWAIAPQTYQLTPQQIDSFKGANNLWASTGEIEVEYRADIGLYIEKKLS